MRKLRKEIKDKSIADLQQEVLKIREEIGKLSIERKVKAEKDTNLIMKKKKQIAMLLTTLNEKKALELLEQK